MITRETVSIYTDKVRHACIKNGWYTCGDNSAYMKMFDMCRYTYSVENLQAIAEDIYKHTDEKVWDPYGVDEEDAIIHIMWVIRNECSNTMILKDYEEVK